jgi:hypothetical protein
MDKIKLKELIKKAIALKEKKNAVGKVPSIGLTIHVDSTYDAETKQLNITVSNQTGKSPEYVVPETDESQVQEIVSGLESEMGAVIRAFSKSIEKVLSKYQQQ